MKDKIKTFLLLTVGITVVTFAVCFFQYPNNFCTGGITGLANIVAYFIPSISQQNFSIIANILLLVLGYIILGKTFSVRTIYCVLLACTETKLFEIFFPVTAPLTDEPFFECVFLIIVISLGSALLLNLNSSTGGTDILALILKKKTTLNIGNALLVSDFLVALSSFFLFGTQIGFISTIGLFLKSFLVDNFIEMLNLGKYFSIITTKPKELSDFIINELKRGVTEENAIGVYTQEPKKVLLVVCSRKQAVVLKNKIKEIDPYAFYTITNTSDIVGKGFHTF